MVVAPNDNNLCLSRCRNSCGVRPIAVPDTPTCLSEACGCRPIPSAVGSLNLRGRVLNIRYGG